MSTQRCSSLLLCIAVLLVAGCASLGHDPLSVTVAGIEPMKGEGMELRLGVKLRVQNPNDEAIDFDGAHVALNVQGKSFASGVSDARGTVPRYGETVVTIPVTVPMFKMAIGALGVINGNYTGKIDYDLDGKLDGPTFSGVRFKSSGQLDLSGIASRPSN